MNDWGEEYLRAVRSTVRAQRTLVERALAQLSDDELLRTLGEEDNSIAVIMKHLDTSDKVEVLATNKLDERIDASPAAVGKELFLRGPVQLYCIAAESERRA